MFPCTMGCRTDDEGKEKVKVLHIYAAPFHHEMSKEKTTFTSGFLRASDENRTHVFSLEG